MAAKKTLKTIGFCALITAWVAALSIGCQYLVGKIMVLILGERAAEPIWNTVFYILSYTVIISLTIVLTHKLIKKLRANREELGLNGLPTWTDIGLAPIAWIASIVLAWALAAIFSFLPWFNANQAQDIGYDKDTLMTAADRLCSFISVVVVAPIAEEIIFRGWLYGKLRARLAMPAAMLITSVAFGLVHMQWNIGVNVFAVSLILCGLREITGTVYSGILVHMLKNGVAFFIVYVLGIS